VSTKQQTTAKVVRHGAVKRPKVTPRSNDTDLGIDRASLLKQLVKFSRSTDEQVALTATLELLKVVK
jgi:hypothetical protein